MTIRLSWPSQAAKALTAIEVYRKVGWDATIDVNAPGTPIATLSGTATEYIEDVTTLTNKTIYKYWIAAVKGGERLLGAPVTQGYFLDTGPGPTELIRGDWESGFFGTLTPTEFFNVAELKGLLPALASYFGADPALWYKFTFRGTIVFIADRRMGTTTFQNLYQNGLVYGTNTVGNVVPSGATATNQWRTVDKNGRRYSIRLPRAGAIDALNPYTDTTVGEWRRTMGRIHQYSLASSQPKFGDLDKLQSSSDNTGAGSTMLSGMYSNQYMCVIDGASPDNVTIVNGLTSQSAYRFAFELILP